MHSKESALRIGVPFSTACVPEVCPDLDPAPWLEGVAEPLIEIETKETKGFTQLEHKTTLKFVVTKTEVERSMPKRVFLSHKGVDKPRIREFANALREVGFDPWLDEDAMSAGVSLERGLLQGMEDQSTQVKDLAHYFSR